MSTKVHNVPKSINVLVLLYVILNYSCSSQSKIVRETQKNIVSNAQREILSDFCRDLKISNITYRPDTQFPGLGVYEDIAEKYFDKVEMKKNFEKDTSYYDNVTKFLFVQNYIRILQEYYKYIPTINLKVVDYAQSKNLDSSWQIGDKDEIKTIKNSYILLYSDEAKEIELMLIFFNPKNNRIIYLGEHSQSPEDLNYLNDVIKRNRKQN